MLARGWGFGPWWTLLGLLVSGPGPLGEYLRAFFGDCFVSVSAKCWTIVGCVVLGSEVGKGSLPKGGMGEFGVGERVYVCFFFLCGVLCCVVKIVSGGKESIHGICYFRVSALLPHSPTTSLELKKPPLMVGQSLQVVAPWLILSPYLGIIAWASLFNCFNLFVQFEGFLARRGKCGF